jgi:hypothetical protein
LGPDKADPSQSGGLHFDRFQPVGRGAFGKIAGKAEEAFLLKGGSQSAVAAIWEHHCLAGALGHEAPGVALIIDGGGTGAGSAGAGGAIVFAGKSNAIALSSPAAPAVWASEVMAVATAEATKMVFEGFDIISLSLGFRASPRVAAIGQA